MRCGIGGAPTVGDWWVQGGRGIRPQRQHDLSHCRYLKAAKVPLNEYEFPTSKLANVQSQLEKLISKNYYLHQSAKDAYR